MPKSNSEVQSKSRKRRAPEHNTDHKIESEPSASKTERKIFPLPIPERPSRNGNALVCGMGDVGQLGLGHEASKFQRRRPTLVPGIKNVVDVCAGGMHTLILTENGVVYSFGCNDEGALGRKTNNEGGEYEPGIVQLAKKAVMISAGDSHSACLLEDGTVWAWGSFRDSHGNMGLDMDGNKFVAVNILPGIECASIASGSDHLVILSRAGHIFTVGCAEQGQLGRITQRSASGEGRRGKLDLLRPCKVFLRRCRLIDAIWATNYCTFIRESRSGRILAFGLNNYKQVMFANDVSVVINPVVTECSDVRMIAGGQHHTIVLKTDGTVHVIGRHDYGRLGLGELQEDVIILTLVEALKGKYITDISCGEATSFAITDKGELFSWGIGSNNQLGTGSDDDESTPVHIQSKETINKRIFKAASGGQHSVFLVEATLTQNETNK